MAMQTKPSQLTNSSSVAYVQSTSNPMGGVSSFSSQSTIPPPMSSFGGSLSQTSGFQSPNPGLMTSASGFGTPQTSAFGQQNQTATQSKDLSAFDNLLPSKPKVSMNAMHSNQRSMTPSSQPFAGTPQSGMGNMGMFVSAGAARIGGGMMGSQQPMMGHQGFMGAQGMMGSPGMMGNMTQQNVMGQNMSQSNAGTKKLSNQELADFLG